MLEESRDAYVPKENDDASVTMEIMLFQIDR